MLLKHGAYYLKHANKWSRLDTEYGPALIKYAELIGSRTNVRTVASLVASYIEHSSRRLSPKTMTNYLASAKNLGAVFGHMDVSDLRAEDVYRYLVSKGNVQANRDKALLSAAFTHGRRIGVVSGEDPAKGLRFRNTEKPRDRYVTDIELEALITVSPPTLACMIRIAYLTGMRQGDLLSLRLDNLTPNGIVYRPEKNKKSAKLTTIAWTDELRRAVNEALVLYSHAGRTWLFESRPRGAHSDRGWGPYTTSGLQSMWRAARAKAGLIDITLHDIRGKAGSDMASDEQAQALLTHADSSITRKHYRRKSVVVKPVR